MRFENGVPREIGDLSPEPAFNRPTASEDPRWVLDEHLRAHAAFIAQLQAQIDELKRRLDDQEITYEPIDAENVPERVRLELELQDIGRFKECATEGGWFRLDRATGQFSRRVK